MHADDSTAPPAVAPQQVDPLAAPRPTDPLAVPRPTDPLTGSRAAPRPHDPAAPPPPAEPPAVRPTDVAAGPSASWIYSLHIPPPRWGHSAVLFGSRMVVFGGADGQVWASCPLPGSTEWKRCRRGFAGASRNSVALDDDLALHTI